MEVALRAEFREQDEALRRRGLEIWLGAEPTFTDRRSQDPWWLADAEGGDKLARARALLLALAPRLPGRPRLVRLVGRAFPGEPAPRFCLGALFSRAGAVAPADPAAIDTAELDGDPVPRPAPEPGRSLLTVTPDPGVVEVNAAPAPDLATFAEEAAHVYAAAEAAGLSAVRYRYNGEVSDSGGGGQLTLGGPTPERSPFFVHPWLLPRLVRYLSNHPALSYAFAGACVGSASQGPRPDEGVRERFEALQVTVDLLEGRGRLGVVELRSLRMPSTASRLAAVAALFRAVTARLVVAPYGTPLADWGSALHDALSLPSYLGDDLRAVLADLSGCGLGLGPATEALLLEGPEPLVELHSERAKLTVTPALEFWPLLGDAASQVRASARLVDASSERFEVAISLPRGQRPGRLGAAGWEVPLHAAAGGQRHVAALRRRSFAPRPGLHPGPPAMDPLVITWERDGQRTSIELHGWAPGGGSYPGLPADAAEARRRRRERVVVGSPGPLALVAPPALRGVTLDLGRLDALHASALRALERPQ